MLRRIPFSVTTPLFSHYVSSHKPQKFCHKHKFNSNVVLLLTNSVSRNAIQTPKKSPVFIEPENSSSIPQLDFILFSFKPFHHFILHPSQAYCNNVLSASRYPDWFVILRVFNQTCKTFMFPHANAACLIYHIPMLKHTPVTNIGSRGKDPCVLNLNTRRRGVLRYGRFANKKISPLSIEGVLGELKSQSRRGSKNKSFAPAKNRIPVI